MKQLKTMQAHVGSLNDLNNPNYIFEPKIDGVRALCYFSHGKYTFISRNGIDISGVYFSNDLPASIINAKQCVLDGEIAAFDEYGKSAFQMLQEGKGTVRYIIFDILEKDNKLLTKLPLLERKKILEETVNPTSPLVLIPYTRDGQDLWKEIKKHHWEGVMAKDAMGHYHQDQRSYTWLKIKEFNTIDCVIIGFESKKRTIAALALGVYDKHKKLHYIGKVGTGFNEKMLDYLEKLLTPIIISKKMIIEENVPNITWVKPKYVAEIAYMQITKAQRLRIPSFKRLRPDKKPTSCTIKEQLKQ